MLSKYIENVQKNLYKIICLEFSKEIVEQTKYDLNGMCGVNLSNDVIEYIQRLYISNYIDKEFLYKLSHVILIYICYNIIFRELQNTYSDHVLRLDILAYGLNSDEFIYLQDSELKMDHGYTRTTYIKEYLDKDILDETIKLFKIKEKI